MAAGSAWQSRNSAYSVNAAISFGALCAACANKRARFRAIPRFFQLAGTLQVLTSLESESKDE